MLSEWKSWFGLNYIKYSYNNFQHLQFINSSIFIIWGLRKIRLKLYNRQNGGLGKVDFRLPQRRWQVDRTGKVEAYGSS